MLDNVKAIVLFSGPGGVCTGLRDAGIVDSVGVEYDDAAVATARAAGHKVFQGDVRLVDPYMLGRHYGLVSSRLRLLLQSSPPCQGLSPAGKGKGREDIELLFAALDRLATLAPVLAAHEIPGMMADLEENCSDERSPLTFETIRWIARLAPEYVMLEQVPTALPIWQKFAEVLTAWGYSVWTGNCQAEQFGVPQTRKRAILLATRTGSVSAPVPTHSKYHSRSPEKLDEGVQKWVSMAEALGWGPGRMVSNYGTGGDPSKRGVPDTSQPAPTVTSKIDRNVIEFAPAVVVAAGITGEGRPPEVGHPAPTITGKGTAYWLESADDWRREAAPEWGGPDDEEYWATMEWTSAREYVETDATRELIDRRYAELGRSGLKVVTGQNSRQAGGETKLYEKSCDAPAPTVTGQVRSWRVEPSTIDDDFVPAGMGDVRSSHGSVRPVTSPAPTITASADNGNFQWVNSERYAELMAERGHVVPELAVPGDGSWTHRRPSPTIVGSFAPDVVAAPGYRKAGDPPRQKTPGSVRVTIEEAGILQSFPHDYPWQGTKGKRYQQCGNAVPPLLAQRLVEGLCKSESVALRDEVAA